jgi:glycosyltransferase involved in cell wall biosynthesis
LSFCEKPIQMYLTKNDKLVSIIIPSLNEEKNIGRCLSSIQEIDISSEYYEILLIDNGSTDKTCEIAASFKDKLNIKLLSAPEVNISVLRNIGAKNANGNILAFVDADCTVSLDWITNALPHFTSNTIGAVGSNVRSPDNASWVAETWNLSLSKKRFLGDIDFLPSGNLIVTKDNFNKVNGFDESLKTNEDYDFCFRLRQQGLRIYSDPTISVTHWGTPQTLVEFYKREKWHGIDVLRNFLQDIRKLKNLKAVLYSLYYTICIFLISVSFFHFIISHEYIYLITFVLAIVIAPIVLSIRTLSTQGKSIKHIVKLSVLYFIYGIARAVSIININNWVLSNKLRNQKQMTK